MKTYTIEFSCKLQSVNVFLQTRMWITKPALAAITFLVIWHTAAATGRIDCSRVRCRRPLCANPVTPPGECCPSCENSGCKFEGCVNFRSNGEPLWQPSPCFQCSCSDNETICAIIDCFALSKEDCFGRPVITRPWECCPSCDFGTPDDRCSAVPIPKSFGGLSNITVSNGFRSCSREVILHTCTPRAFRSRGKKFRCEPRESKRPVKFEKGCPLCVGFYQDVVRCKAVRDDDEIVGCDLFVD